MLLIYRLQNLWDALRTLLCHILYAHNLKARFTTYNLPLNNQHFSVSVHFHRRIASLYMLSWDFFFSSFLKYQSHCNSHPRKCVGWWSEQHLGSLRSFFLLELDGLCKLLSGNRAIVSSNVKSSKEPKKINCFFFSKKIN